MRVFLCARLTFWNCTRDHSANLRGVHVTDSTAPTIGVAVGSSPKNLGSRWWHATGNTDIRWLLLACAVAFVVVPAAWSQEDGAAVVDNSPAAQPQPGYSFQAGPPDPGAAAWGSGTGTIDAGVGPNVVGGFSSSPSYNLAGATYNPALDTVLRLRYATRSYGQQDGNLDIGTFTAFPFGDDALTFFDGQVVLNEDQGVGYNLGLGIRFLTDTFFTPDPTRITGVSVWADGTGTRADNFFAQVGVSWESLGDLWDFRVNGYAPVSNRFLTGDFQNTGGDPTFFGNNLVLPTVADFDTAFFAAEVEAARRLGNREAWGFAGAYKLDSGNDDTTGYRAGIRGYAVPDVLLQIAVSNDEIFNTNAAFSLTWFVGRTRSDYAATCSVVDRFREPVMRNDYVVIQTTQVAGGEPLDDLDGDPFSFVHVASAAPAGGDGTFEDPLNDLDLIDTNSTSGDIVFTHATSSFTDESAVLHEDQRFLGEGDGFVFTVDTEQRGTIEIPESSPGARDEARPIIAGGSGSSITLADNNEVANFLIEDGTSGINGASIDGVTDPNLHDLTIQNMSGTGIQLRAGARVDTDDADDDGDTNDLRIPFAVEVSNITFEDITVHGLDIDAQAFHDGSPVDPTAADVDMEGDITISNIKSTGGTSASFFANNLVEADGQGKMTISGYDYDGENSSFGGLKFEDISAELIIQNFTANNGRGPAASFTRLSTSGIVNVDNMIYDGGVTGAGGLRLDDVDADNGAEAGVTVRNSSFTNGTGDGVQILNDSSGIFSFDDTNIFNSVDGTTFLIDGDEASVGDSFTGVVTVGAEIINDTGQSVSLRSITGDTTFSTTFNGDITDSGGGIEIISNTGEQVALFSGNLDLDTGSSAAIFIVGNTASAETSFGGDIDINTTSGAGFFVSGGGKVAATGSNNTITTTTGNGLTFNDTDVVSQLNFEQVNVDGAQRGIDLENVSEGSIRIGPTGAGTGEGGTLTATTDDSIDIANVDDVVINGVTINKDSTNNNGVSVVDDSGGDMNVTLDNINVTKGDQGLNVDGSSGSGNFALTISDSSFDESGLISMNFTDVDNGTIGVFNTTVDGQGQAITSGIGITDSNAAFTFDTNSSVENVSGPAFSLNGGNVSINHDGDIDNSSGNSIRVQNVTGGTLAQTGTVTDTGTGIVVEDNSGGNLQLTGDYDLDTTTNDAVAITDNTGANVSIRDLDINTTTGTGFKATGGGNLTVSGTNDIDTTTGIGIDIQAMDILTQATFNSVNVSNGSTQGINLENATGSQVTVGNSAGAAGSGGSITTTSGDNAIQLTNVTNVDINNVDVVDAGAVGVAIAHEAGDTNSMNVTLNGVEVTSAGNQGIEVQADNSNGLTLTSIDTTISAGVSSQGVDLNVTDGNANVVFTNLTSTNAFEVDTSTNAGLDMNLNTSQINSTVTMIIDGPGSFDLSMTDTSVSTGNDDVAFTLNLGTQVSTNSGISIQSSSGGSSSFQTGDAVAFAFNPNTNKTVNFLVDDVNFSNASGGNKATQVTSLGSTILNATVTNNVFTNSISTPTEIIADDTSTLNLNLTANMASGGDLTLEEIVGADFKIQDVANVVTDNPSAIIDFQPAFIDFDNFPGTVPTP